MMICEKCANRQNCEYVPYDVECDTKFKDIREDYMDKMCHSLGLENEIVIVTFENGIISNKRKDKLSDY